MLVGDICKCNGVWFLTRYLTLADVDDTMTSSDIPANYKFALHAVVVPILFAAVTLLGLAGNTLVIVVIVTRVRMRTVTNILLLNLAVADLSFVLVIPPFTAYEYVAGELPTSSWALGSTVCKLLHYLVNVTAYVTVCHTCMTSSRRAPAYVTVYTLVLIAVVRYMTIVHNARTARLRQRSRVVATLGFIWVGMLLVNAPILGAYTVRRVGDVGRCSCDLVDQSLGRTIFATFFAFAYVIPLCVIAVFSLLILAHLARQKSSFATVRSGSRQRRVTRLLLLIVVVFAVFWLPIHVHLLVAFFGHIPADSSVYMTLSVVWNCLAYANSCVNPIIYNYTCKDFRAAFRSVVYGCCPSGCDHSDEVREVNYRDDVDDGNDDDDDDDVAEPAIELQLHTDVTVVRRLTSVGCNRAKTMPVVRIKALSTADVSSV